MSRKPRQGGSLRFQPAGGGKRDRLPVGKKQSLRIERLADDGRGIAFVDKRTWFVSGALPGEQVQARVLHARSQIIDASTEQVQEASPIRRRPPCPHAQHCGGCSLQHLAHPDQLELKTATLKKQLARLSSIADADWAAPLFADELAYRRRARIAVRWNAQEHRLDVGFRAESSQRIVAVEQCPVLVAPLQRIFHGLPELLSAMQQPRHIGHVELFSGNVEAILLRHTAPLGEQDRQMLEAFARRHDAQLWLQGDGEPQPVFASEPLGYSLEDLFISYRPGDFVQVNGELNRRMVAQALDWLAVGPDESVLDLFCGLGNFALPLARQAREVIAVEGVEEMVARARENASRNALENVQFFRADLSETMQDQAWFAEDFSAVLLDPPRDGAAGVVEHLAGLEVPRILYVSCNPATLARDALELERQGYRLSRVGMIDMFPQTAHVEAMALFERSATQVAERVIGN